MILAKRIFDGGKTELKMILYVLLLLLYVVQKHTVYLCAFASVNVQVFCFGRQNRLGCHWRDEGRLIVCMCCCCCCCYYYCCYCYCARVAISEKLTLAAPLPLLWHNYQIAICFAIKNKIEQKFTQSSFDLMPFLCEHFGNDTDHLHGRTFIFCFSLLSKTVKSVYFNGAIKSVIIISSKQNQNKRD